MVELRCKGIVDDKPCKRFFKIEPLGTCIMKVTCPDRQCKAVMPVKIVTTESSDADLRFKFGEKE